MKLYDINELLYRALENEDGAIDEVEGFVYDTAFLDSLEVARAEKLEGATLYAEQCGGSAKILRERIKSLSERAKTLENKEQRLKEWVITELERFGDKHFEGRDIRATVRENTSVSITDADALPEKYLKAVTDVKPIKDEIKAAIKAGVHVPGAELKISKSLLIK